MNDACCVLLCDVSDATVCLMWHQMPLTDSTLRSMHRSLYFCALRTNTLSKNYASDGLDIPPKVIANSTSKQYHWRNLTVICFRVCCWLLIVLDLTQFSSSYSIQQLFCKVWSAFVIICYAAIFMPSLAINHQMHSIFRLFMFMY